ncbi:dynein axonemal heavy chain 9-like, partial [Patagioenas fasciata]|uniref:dynein axonemal heavy chain 9-like n=1 Tax=Patagioenas fasciata TaxID=372321 RepID=UPI003A994FB5
MRFCCCIFGVTSAVFSQTLFQCALPRIPPVHKNMPPVAGALRWAQELRARIQVPFDHFRHIPHLCLDSAEGRRVIEKYEEMIQLLDRYQEKLYADWSQTVSEKSQYNLTQPLIRRDPETKLITVNFDP